MCFFNTQKEDFFLPWKQTKAEDGLANPDFSSTSLGGRSGLQGLDLFAQAARKAANAATKNA